MIIYKAENKIDKKVYIGKTIVSLEKRKWQHIYQAKRKKYKTYFYSAIIKHSEENFEWSILCETDSESKLNVLEKFYIACYKKMGIIYNQTDGGDGCSGRIQTQEIKNKISNAQKGEKNHNFGKHLSIEHRKKISEKSKNISNDTRKKMSKSHQGKQHSNESKNKIAQWHKGKNFSEDTKIKMIESAKKRIKKYGHPRKGIHLSDETKLKISLGNKGKKLSEDTKNKISESAKKISKETRLKMSESHKGKKQSQETLDKKRMSLKLYWANRKGLL